MDQWFRRRCPLKIFIIYNSGSIFVQRSRTICANLVDGIMSNIPVNMNQWLRRRGHLKMFLIYSSGCHFVQQSQSETTCQFERVHNEEHFCETILRFDQWFKRRCLLNIFLIYSSGGKDVLKSRTICAFVVEGIMRNISVK